MPSASTVSLATSGSGAWTVSTNPPTGVFCAEAHGRRHARRKCSRLTGVVIKLYGTANGFGWKMDEVIGAQIVSVPMSLPLNMADQTFQSLMKWLAGAFLGIGLIGNLAAAVVAPRKRQ